MLSNLNEHAYILMDEDEAIGQVRLSVDGDEAEITYSIEEQYRYLGYGKIILQLVENVVASEMLDVKLVAKVKSDNVASQHIFEKLQVSSTVEMITKAIKLGYIAQSVI